MTARILIVDDDPLTLDLLDQALTGDGYQVARAASGDEALRTAASFLPQVILLDYILPGMDGVEVVRRLRQDDRFKAVPIILITGRGGQEDKVRGLGAGADDYVVKPFDHVELMARVRSMVRIRQMHEALEEWGRTLEEKVRQQVDQINRMSRLTRYVSPQIAQRILAGDDTFFTPHRREITAVAIALHGFAAFSDTAEPEEIMDLYSLFDAEMGRLILNYDGTLERFTGDGISMFFNDPLPVPGHTERAVRMAIEMRERMRDLRQGWLKRGYDLDLKVGLAAGFATLGPVGFESRIDYTAVGRAPTLAIQLADAASGGQILTDQKTFAAVGGLVDAAPLGELQLKAFARPVSVFNITDLTPGAMTQRGGPLSPREQEVAAQVARDLSNREIAAALYISERTAESHIQNILNKLGFHNRSEIAAWATAQGLHKQRR